jgi:hypothetical protein
MGDSSGWGEYKTRGDCVSRKRKPGDADVSPVVAQGQTIARLRALVGLQDKFSTASNQKIETVEGLKTPGMSFCGWEESL